MANILIIDDELMVRTLLAEVVTAQGHTAAAFSDLSGGLAHARTHACDLIYLDVLLPDGNGLEALPELKKLPSAPEVIVITSHGDPDGAEQAVRHGVWEYLHKPFTVDRISLSLERALSFRHRKLHTSGGVSLHRPDIIGNSPALLSSLDLAAEASSTNVNVLLLGETGTGKELFAKVIHQNSVRSHKPFVTLDCASCTDSLIESQLFGHVRGAFTGADRHREGLLKLAHGGTLFLDEIGDLPLHIQGNFLRALETRRFRPVGASHETESDFRLIAATNKDLHEMVRLDMFRADLLYRLRGLTITLPPLRRRQEDLPLLIEYYLDRHCRTYGVCNKHVSGDFMEAATAYDWPGNIRELVHALERACTASQGDPALFARQLPTEIRVQVARTLARREAENGLMPAASSANMVPSYADAQTAHPASATGEPHIRAHQQTIRATPHPVHEITPSAMLSAHELLPPADTLPTLKEFRHEAELRYLQNVLRLTAGNIRKAVEITGLSRGHLYGLMKKYGISP